MSHCCKKKSCYKCPPQCYPAYIQGPPGATGSTGATGQGGGGNLTFINNIGTTVPVANVINTSGTGGNITFGNGADIFQVRDLRSLSQYVVGNDPTTSEYQTVQSAILASEANVPPANTFNVIYLQPGIQYVEDLTISGSVIIRGQEGATIIGDINIGAGIGVFFFDAIVFGTITSLGVVTFVTSVITGTSSALIVNGGTLNVISSSFLNDDLFNPTIVINGGGGNIDINGAVIKNNLQNGYAIRINNTFTGTFFLRSSRIPSGQSYLIQGSIIVGNTFESQSPVTLFLDNSDKLDITFTANDVNADINITKENSDNSYIIVSNNNFTGTMSLNSQNNTTIPTVPHIQIRDNTIINTSINTTFNANTFEGIILFDNNFIQCNVYNGMIGGTPGIVSMTNNKILGQVTYKDSIAKLDGNTIISSIFIPLSISYALGSVVDHIVYNNIISTSNTLLHTLLGSLSGASHRLILASNNLTTNAAQDLFDVTLAGGSTFLTDSQNDNINASPQGSLFSGGISTL